MTSIFGHYRKGRIGARGRLGVPGAAGESGIAAMCKWLPKTLLQHFRENEEMFCLMLTDLSRDVKKATGGGSLIDSWYSRGSVKRVFTSKRRKGKLIKTSSSDEKASGIHFQNCVYQLDGANLIQTHIKSQTEYSDILFMTFRTTANMNTKDERVLLSSHSEGAEIFREISVDSIGNLFVIDKRFSHDITTPIQYRIGVWNTLIVEWYYSEKNSARCLGRVKIANTAEPDTAFEIFYNIQSPLKDDEEKSSRIITLGGRADGSKTFEGDIHCVEYYRVSHNESIYGGDYGDGAEDSTDAACYGEGGMGGFPEKNLFPQPLRSLIKSDVMYDECDG